MTSIKLKSFKLVYLLSLISLLSACNGGITPNKPSSNANQVIMAQEISFDQIGQIPADDKPHSYFIRLFNYSDNDYQLKQLSLTNITTPQLAKEIMLDALGCKKISAHGECEIKLSGIFKQAKSYLIKAILSDATGAEVNTHQMLRVVEYPAVDAIELPGYGNAIANVSTNQQLNLVLPFILRNDLSQLNTVDSANIHCENNYYRKGSACSYQLSTNFQNSQEVTTHISATTMQGIKSIANSISKITTAQQANLLVSQAREIDLSTSPANPSTTISLYNNGTTVAQNIQLQLPADKQLKVLDGATNCTTTLVPGTSCNYTLRVEKIEQSAIKDISLSYQAHSGAITEELKLPLVVIAPAHKLELLLEPDRSFDTARVAVDYPLLLKVKNTGTQTMSNLRVNGDPFDITGYQMGSALSLCRLNDASFNLVPDTSCYVYARVDNNPDVELSTTGTVTLTADAKNNTASYLAKQDNINIAPDSALQVNYLAGLEWSWLEYYQNDNYLDKITVKNIGSRATTPQLEVLLPTEVFNVVNNCNVSLAANSECTIKYSPTIQLNSPQKIFSIKNAAAKAPRETILNIVDTFVFTGEKRYTEQTPRKYTLSPVIKKSLWQIESVSGGVWDKTAHAIGGPGGTYENRNSPVILPLGPEAEDPRDSGSSYFFRGYIQQWDSAAIVPQYADQVQYKFPALNLYGALGSADALGYAKLSYINSLGNQVAIDFPIRLSHYRPADVCGIGWRHPLGSAGYFASRCQNYSFAKMHDVNIYIWGPDLSSQQKQDYCAATQNSENKQIKQLLIVTWPFWYKCWWHINSNGGASLKEWNDRSLISTAPNPGQLNDRLKDKLDDPDFIRTIGEKRPYAADMLQELFEVTVEVDSSNDPICTQQPKVD